MKPVRFFDKAADGRENRRWVAARNRLVSKFQREDKYLSGYEALQKANAVMDEKEKTHKQKKKRK